ncbi:MAG TPA: MotA/TolQ/ExbB proton channel family protein [Rhizomicrobium sp.]|jgi:hypothetical protein|nr:MotA/TolQ/ExbB proton channel family protein [Rhizomicrobium sp.]
MAFAPDLPVQTWVFLAVMFGLWVWFNIQFNHRTAVHGPAILTTIGILGTFVGISIALLQFDPNQMDRAVPELLSGLKTAFIASACGVFGAVTIKLRHHFFARYDETFQAARNSGAHDVAALLAKIQMALVGQDESTLLSQLKLSRQDTNDRLDALKKAQQEALQRLSELSSKAVVEALRDVIRDFNSKITEQFGENFAHLNQAVGKLLEWQEAYKAHLEASARRHEATISAMTVATEKYRNLVEKADTFTQTSSNLSRLLSGLETQRAQLAGALEQFANLIRTASTGLPEIEKNILALTQQLASAVTTSQREVNKALSENSAQIRTTISAASQQISEANKEINRNVSELVGKTKEQVLVLDRALSEELQKSLESLGKQLSALSEKFVADYRPLTDKLREIVQISRAA